jgi:hypothetical protein
LVLFSSVANRRLGIEDLDARGEVDVLGLDLAGAGGDQRGLDLIGIGVHPHDDVLEVEDQVGYILLQARDVENSCATPSMRR